MVGIPLTLWEGMGQGYYAGKAVTVQGKIPEGGWPVAESRLDLNSLDV
jgi:hypothetical protein